MDQFNSDTDDDKDPDSITTGNPNQPSDPNEKDSDDPSNAEPTDPTLEKLKSFAGSVKKKGAKNNDTLDNFGTNLNYLAKGGMIAQGFSGREEIIRKMIETMCNRDTPNPILVGNQGCGKTEIVHYLAKLISTGAVPDKLKDKVIYSIDINDIVAGTMYRGQLEEKIQTITKTAMAARNVILFFDELHMLRSAGDSSESQNVFMNALKGPLGSGMLKIIGATSEEEFEVAFSKDLRFSRRLKKIQVSDLSKQDILKIIENKTNVYEEFHKVKFDRNHLELVYSLAERFIPDRFFPEKALTVLDIILTKESLKPFYDTEGHKDTYAGLQLQLTKLIEEKDKAIAEEEFTKAGELRSQILYIQYRLETGFETKESKTLISSKDTVFTAVKDISNNDIVNPTIETKERFKNLRTNLMTSVIGQNEAIDKVASAIQSAKYGIKDKNKPLATMLFLGKTGTGKTLLAKKLAENVFGSKNFFKFDMSEYDTEISSSKLLGSNPGFVGYNESSPLQTAIKNNPFSVFLFDEIEKAHPKILDLFLQLLDEGRITTNNKVTLNFTNAIIIMTSNIGSHHLRKSSKIALDPSSRSTGDQTRNKIIESLYDHMRPEMINRFDEILVFNEIKNEDCKKIVDLELNYIREIGKDKNITFSVTDGAMDKIVKESFSEDFGARNVRRYVQKNINKAISSLLIQLDVEDNIDLIIDIKNNELIAISK